METPPVPAPVRVTTHGAGMLTLEGVHPDEHDVLLGAFKQGTHWVRLGKDGRIENVPSFEPLPAPAPDIALEPYWTPLGREHPIQPDLFLHAEMGDWHHNSSPSITIQHLCGYGYTPEKYQEHAALLEEFGFVCLRSRRLPNGCYWEQWVLAGTWAAKGRLRKAIVESRSDSEKLETEAAIGFLRRTVEFGTLDVSVQRLAQAID